MPGKNESQQQWTSTFEGLVKYSEGRQLLRRGQTIAADHPLRLERPDLFVLADPEPQIQVPHLAGRGEPPVERGTRAPGERRGQTGGSRDAA